MLPQIVLEIEYNQSRRLYKENKIYFNKILVFLSQACSTVAKSKSKDSMITFCNNTVLSMRQKVFDLDE